MNAKKTYKMYLLRLLPLLALFLSIILCASVVQARLRVSLHSDSTVALGEPESLSAICEYCVMTPGPLPVPLYCEACGVDVTWAWTIMPLQPDAMYDFDLPNSPNPVFTGHTVGDYDVLVTACKDDDCGFDSGMTIHVYDPIVECPLPDRTSPIVVYDPPESGLEFECVRDSDGNGLDDAIEKLIAQCFVPEFRFDVSETWYSLGTEEPRTVFNIAPDVVAEDGSLHIRIRYGMVWGYDAGFVNDSDPLCHNPFGIGDPQAHAGDTQAMAVTAWLKKRDGRPQWYAQIEYITGFQDFGGVYWSPAATVSGTHPKVYPSAGKHHFRYAPGYYDYDVKGAFTCRENAYGNRTPFVVPSVEHVAHFPHTALQYLQLPLGQQGGPPILIDGSGRSVWANACNLIKGNPDTPALSLRPVDLTDWIYPACQFGSDIIPLADIALNGPDLCNYPVWANYLSWPCGSDSRLCHTIVDTYFWTAVDDFKVDPIWSLVSGGFSTDVDGDGLSFWADPCPVAFGNDSTDYLDSDNDGYCDAIDLCPHDPTDDADLDGFCGSPPTCNSGGPYDVQCSGPNTLITLNATTSSDPEGLPLTYSWSTDCTGSFDDSGSATPVLTADSSSGCSINCNVYLTVTDADGAAADCVAPVSVTDTQGPDITCAADQTRECSDSTDPSDTGYASASDTCDSSPTMNYASGITAGSCPNEWTINRTWTASDDCGNANSCNQVITVVDSTPPDIVCPPDVTIECDEATDPSSTGVASAVDNCSGSPSISYLDETAADPSCPSVGIITRTWTADDACGNTSSCSQMITLEDTKGPVITCNAPATIIPPDAPVSFSAAAADNCDTDSHIEITGYDCFTNTQKGKRISKLESCMVNIDNNMLTVLDSGGVDTTITWGVLAADCADNQSTAECAVTIVNPSQ